MYKDEYGMVFTKCSCCKKDYALFFSTSKKVNTYCSLKCEEIHRLQREAKEHKFLELIAEHTMYTDQQNSNTI